MFHAQEAGEPQHAPERGDQDREPHQPPAARQGADAEQRDRDAEQGLRHVELVVVHVQAVVVLLRRFRRALDLLLLPRVFLDARGVDGDLLVEQGRGLRRQAGLRLADLELVEHALGEVLLHPLRLVVGPLVDRLRLVLRHRLHDVAVLDVAQRHEGGEDRHQDGDPLLRVSRDASAFSTPRRGLVISLIAPFGIGLHAKPAPRPPSSCPHPLSGEH